MSLQNSTVRFLLNNTPFEVDLSNHADFQPTTTILNFLRSRHGYKGVKEGCAEGDCGACTVVVAVPDGHKKLKYRAINSCLVFLPWLHGKQLITVESLARGQNLHPVQQLLVDHYGSQCGFCTPGIVMSLFELFKSRQEPTRDNAIRALSGNLCRCTGYQPILEVAIKTLESNHEDHFSENEKMVLDSLLSIQNQSLSIKSGKQTYLKPSGLKEALQLRFSRPDAVIASGATDIAVRQSKKFEFLPEILDISGIDELKFFTEDDDGWTIGSGMPIEDLWQLSVDKIPMFDEVFRVFASHQIRNLATLGGNIASASPIGDTLPVLMALNAAVELENIKGRRTLPVEQFITAYRQTAMLLDEIIRSVYIPKPPANSLFRFYKVSKRKELDISTVSLAAMLDLSKENKINKVILTYGGMADRPARALKTEKWLSGKLWTPEIVKEASLLLASDFSPISDARSGKEARNIFARNLLMKLFVETNEIAVNNG